MRCSLFLLNLFSYVFSNSTCHLKKEAGAACSADNECLQTSSLICNSTTKVCMCNYTWVFVLISTNRAISLWMTFFGNLFTANIGTQVWRRVLPGKLCFQRAIMAQLQSWTNALLVLVLCVNQAYVIVLPASNYF